ncbi:MAG: hypothetical protein WCS96_14070 [Victivallales bacterium]
MQTLHQIKHVDNILVTLKLPRNFLKKTVEITVAQIANTDTECLKKRRLQKIFDSASHRLPRNYRFDRDEIHER